MKALRKTLLAMATMGLAFSSQSFTVSPDSFLGLPVQRATETRETNVTIKLACIGTKENLDNCQTPRLDSLCLPRLALGIHRPIVAP